MDCSRYNLFATLRIINPFSPSIKWNKHKSPEFWANVLMLHDFENPKMRLMPFGGLRLPKPIFNNRFLSYCLTSNFVLIMEKK